MGDPYQFLGNTIDKLKETNFTITPDTDYEDVVKVGKKLASATARINTLLNYMWSQWYTSIPLNKGWKKGCVESVFGGNTMKSKSELQRLQVLGSVYRNIPTWRFDRDWSFYVKLARLSKFPDVQEKWLGTTPYKGWMVDMETEIKSLVEVKINKRAPKKTNLGGEYKILNTLTGEVMSPEEYDNLDGNEEV